MAREIPISRSFKRDLESRYRNTIYGYLRHLLDTIIPVQQMGSPLWADVDRPLWHIYSLHGNVPGQCTTASITSRYDLAIYDIEWAAWNATPAIVNAPIYICNPVTAWVPWGASPPPGPVYWVPGVRPRLEFDIGNTTVISGSQVPPNPITGYTGYAERGPWNEPTLRGIHYDPPLILPKTMFLTVQNGNVNEWLLTNWRYRELG